MNKLLPAPTILSVLLLLTIACKKNVETIDVKETTVSLYKCNDVKANAGIRICYDSLINESRCPEDAVCIWAGLATIKVSFTENGQIHRFNMLYMTANRQHYNYYGAVSDTSINGYQIKLTDVLPHPKLSGPAPTPDQYKAVFTISR